MSAVPTPPQTPVERRLTHVAPTSTAGIVCFLFFAFSLLVIGAGRFFQLFDPTPPARSPGDILLLFAAWVSSIAFCFAAVFLLCWIFNLLARFTGGIRYRSTSAE